MKKAGRRRQRRRYRRRRAENIHSKTLYIQNFTKHFFFSMSVMSVMTVETLHPENTYANPEI